MLIDVKLNVINGGIGHIIGNAINRVSIRNTRVGSRSPVSVRVELINLRNFPLAKGGVIGCKQFSWLRGVGCGLSSVFEYGGPCCDRCGAGVWVVPGAHRQNTRPVPVGDQGRDQAQRGRRRVLQGRGGGAHGRAPARPSQGARPRCRPCSAGPCCVRPRPGPNAPLDQRAPQGRGVQRGGAPCAGSPAAGGRTISHEAIYTWIYAHPKKTLVEHGIVLPSRRWARKRAPVGGL